ncbi:MAG: alginate lyase family protein [Clostridia bacterium]|nr:alginate lyase family protein [Clostridia bacterium]
MKNVIWLFNRLKAMSIPEVLWRVSQKTLQKKEEKLFKHTKFAVTNLVFNKKLENLNIHAENLCLNGVNKEYSLKSSIPMLGEYSYEKYKKAWNAGFQTNNCWPDMFSYSLEYKQRDDIGDARTNWELNRHFQFAVLAKNYAVSSDKAYLEELNDLFYDWNENNPFLWGISWVSVMEAAIRVSNWCYTYCFLSMAYDVPQSLMDGLRIGILNMTDYITQHYSRFSSANNHLIVEAYAIGQSGILFEYQPWIDTAVTILTRELPLQNYADGVNKELSLHYQSFYMEAMGLMLRLLQKNQISIPESWLPMLDKMCCYVADCMGINGEVAEFGDNDEGKILDLCGGYNHYNYVLGLYSFLLQRRYISLDSMCENLYWLFTEEEINNIGLKPLYSPNGSVCYKEGGNSVLRSKDGRVLIGIDHAALGFGSIAAHGHGDALSFQMFVDGEPVFADPGTYIYHCDLNSRNEFRMTKNHNTVCIDNKNQSEMLGAFLWGKRAECKLIDYKVDREKIRIEACHNGYAPNIHSRIFEYNCADKLRITDSFTGGGKKEINFILSPYVEAYVKGEIINLKYRDININMQFECESEIEIKKDKRFYSKSYGSKCQTSALIISTKGLWVTTYISLNI